MIHVVTLLIFLTVLIHAYKKNTKIIANCKLRIIQIFLFVSDVASHRNAYRAPI